MKRIFKTMLPLVLLVSAFAAQEKRAGSQGQPQIIDRQLLFGNPEIADAEISPDGKYVSFLAQ